MKTVFLSIIVIFLLQLVYNFIYERFLTKIPPENTKFSEIEKYKKIAEEVASAAAVPSIKNSSPPETRNFAESKTQQNRNFAESQTHQNRNFAESQTHQNRNFAESKTQQNIETIFNNEIDLKDESSHEDMEKYLLNLVING